MERELKNIVLIFMYMYYYCYYLKLFGKYVEVEMRFQDFFII